MSALCIITTADEVVIATDGGSFQDDGSLGVIAGKVLLVPEASTAITSRGVIWASDELWHFVRQSPARLDFDTLLELAPLFVERAAARSPAGLVERFEFCLGGWSESRQAHEAWCVRSHEVKDVAAGTLHRLPECHVSNTIPPETAEGFGLRLPETGSCQWRRAPFKWAVLAIAALRFCPKSDPGPSRGKVCVGGFVQVTRISRHAVASEIVMNWDDPVGRPIDPDAALQDLHGAALQEGVFGPWGKWRDEHAG